MLSSRIIPCLDINDGRVVKGVKFQNLRDAGCPVELSIHYQDQGADEIVVLDVSATRQNRLAMLETIESIRRRLCIPLTVGGGVSSIEDAGRLPNAGADKVSVNSAAVADPDLVARLSAKFGAQCTVVAIDARQTTSSKQTADSENSWYVVTRSGTRAESLCCLEWAAQVQQLGAGEILLTSFDRDGTRSGYDLPLLSAVTSACSIPVIASGGADSVAHMVEAFQNGAHAVLAASIFHDGNFTVATVKQQLAGFGIRVRNTASMEAEK